MGKSRLAGEFLARNRASALTLAARAHPLGETSSFGVWAEALEGHLRGRGAGYVSQLCEGFLDDLAVLVRSIALARGGVPDREPPKLRLLAGLAGVLLKLASTRPVIVFFDDMHLADASSWEALGYLARTLSTAPVLLLCAVRPGELADHDVGNEVTLALEQEGRLSRLELGPLRPKGVTELALAVLGEDPPASLARWLVERSRGNPLFALSLLQALLDEGVDLCSPDLRSLPQYVADRIAEQLKRLDEVALRTLELLAVAGQRVDLSDLLRMSDHSVEVLGGALEAMVRGRWVLEAERANDIAYEIAHPLIAEAIYERIGAARRRVLHRVIARAHLAQGRLGAAAPHYARSASPGDAEAIIVLRDAVRQAESRGAYREALAILDALVDLLAPGDPRWASVMEAMSWRAEWVVDHRADTDAVMGIRALHRMDAVLEELADPAARASVKFRLASFLAWGTGELEEAERVCTAALELFTEAGDLASSLLAANELAWIRGLRGDVVAFKDGARRVVEAAQAAGERFTLIQALSAMAVGESWLGHLDRARAAWQRSMTLAAEEGKLYRLVLAQLSLAHICALSGENEEAMALIAAAKSVSAWQESPLPEWESIVHWAAGNFIGALTSAEQTAATARPLSKRRALGLSYAALSAVEADRPEEAERYLGRALAAYQSRHWAYYSDYAVYAQAMVDWRAGDVTRALRALLGVSHRLVPMRVLTAAVFVLVDLAQAAAEAKDTDVGRQAADALAQVARDPSGAFYQGITTVGLAWASFASCQSETAVNQAREALLRLPKQQLSAQRLIYWTARTQEVLGHSLRESDPASALLALEAAGQGFAACAARWRQRRVINAMRHLGGAGQRLAARVAGPDSLTRREREVARLAARGHTAREIAERLTITERTVEGHLGAVYAKLGVSSKLELVRREKEFTL